MSRLREERKRRGLSQFALAREAGVPPQEISMIERGRLKPYPKWRRELARALGVDEGWLFEDVDEDAARLAR